MQIINRSIHPFLRGLVSNFFLASIDLHDRQDQSFDPFPPRPEQALYFYPRDKVTCLNFAQARQHELCSSMVVGPQLTRVDLALGYHTVIIYVGFHPGCLQRFVQTPMHYLLDEAVESSQLFGADINVLTCKLEDSDNFTYMLDLVENYLMRKACNINTETRLNKWFRTLSTDVYKLSVDQLAKNACLSSRQLERQFQQVVGMSPKIFCRLQRFYKAWSLKQNNSSLTWTEISHLCDYADHMHLVRDFKKFTHVNPSLLEKLQPQAYKLQTDFVQDVAFDLGE